MSVPDSSLPVFSFQPDWGQGITEHLEWMTDVLTSMSAAEQRNSLRLSARRSFEVTIAPLEAERTFLDLFIRRFAQQEFMLPLWHDHATLGATATIGATSLTVDTTNHEFLDGGMAILMGADPFTFEAVRISTVSSGALALSAPTTLAWGAGTTIHPLRRSWLMSQPKASHQTDTLDSVPLEFLLSGPSDYDGGSEELATYAGLPILAPAPDWSDGLSLEYARPLVEVDGKVGLRTLGDPAGRSFAIQMHRWFLVGRAEHASFRRLMTRLRGKQGSLWLPSFTADLAIAAAVSAGDTHIDVRTAGLVYTGLQDGRRYAITAGGEMLHFTAVSAPSAGVERLTLSAPITGALAVADTLSFADVGRLDTDTIDIHHQTDSDGVAQVELPCRTFPDIRDGSADGSVALETATMSDTNCGCCTLPTTASWPFAASGTFFSPAPAFAIPPQEMEFVVGLNLYETLCRFYYCSFTVIPAGPQISYTDETGTSHCLTGTNCGSSTGTVTTFDNTYSVTIAGYTLSLRAYYDGANVGIELSNPDSVPLDIIAVPSGGFDYTKPLYGMPAQTDLSAVVHWNVSLNQTGNVDGTWNETAAFAHNYNIQVKAGGVDIAKPFQRVGFPETSYGSAYRIKSFAIYGFTGSPFSDCHASASPMVGAPCA